MLVDRGRRAKRPDHLARQTLGNSQVLDGERQSRQHVGGARLAQQDVPLGFRQIAESRRPAKGGEQDFAGVVASLHRWSVRVNSYSRAAKAATASSRSE